MCGKNTIDISLLYFNKGIQHLNFRHPLTMSFKLKKEKRKRKPQ